MKTETLIIGDIQIQFTRKNVKNVHLAVNPPDGHVTMVAPDSTRTDVARAYAISKLQWIRQQQNQLLKQARETERQFISRESHDLWGRRYLLTVVEREGPPEVKLNHRSMMLFVRPGSDQQKRAKVIHDWHKSILHEIIPPLIRKWELKLGVKVSKYYLRRMKTRWGGCNHNSGSIRLNTELVKKPKDLLEYVIVHELLHLIEPTHNERFIRLLNENYPSWREARSELNELPLGAEKW